LSPQDDTMTDHDLNNLKNLPVPPSRRGAREAAVAVALQAFKTAQPRAADAPQASSDARQVKEADEAIGRSRPIHARRLIAMAASAALFALAVPLVLLQSDRHSTNQLHPGPVPHPSNTDRVITELQPRAADGDQRNLSQIAAAPRPPSEAVRVPSSGLSLREDAPVQVIRQADPDQVEARHFRLAELDAIRGPDISARPRPEQGRERFDAIGPNPVKSVAGEPVSTFSIDVDTASYAFVRRTLNQGLLPPKDAVRVEELINYFPYRYPLPEKRETPFQPTVTVLPSPWNPANKLVHIAVKGYDVVRTQRPRANLVLLIDTSGSMAPDDRLPLLKSAFRMLVDTLQPTDTVGIVTYAGAPSVALEPTKASDRDKILRAIDRLDAEGSTAGAAGIQEAYRMAEAAFDKSAVNRIILGTDGDFNVGITDQHTLKGYIERKRDTGIYLSVLGVGRDNYNDALMQALAQNGNGVAAYVDTLNEARKVLVDEASSTLFPIAKDVKIQVEFNPARVAEYRLIGYETRMLNREDFANDKVNAGVIGSGHAVTAIYEITPVGAPRLLEDLRYGQPSAAPALAANSADECAFLKIRYKLPGEENSRSMQVPIRDGLQVSAVDQVNGEVRFSVAVAAFGQLLRGEPYLRSFGYNDIVDLATGAKGDDPFGYRAEFINLVRLAKSARP
jgi:Ca-activated chloride channel family protein